MSSMNVQKLQARTAVDVTPNDSTDITPGDQVLYVGTGGNVKVTTADGSTVTFTNVPSGAILPVSVRRVFSTGTTATGIIAIR